MSPRAAACADFPTYYALAVSWRQVPPADIQLARIAAFLGIKTSEATRASPVQTSAPPGAPVSPQDSDAHVEAGISQLQQAGFPAFQGPLSPTVSAMLADLPLK
jgi:hypothetical protein